MAAISAGILLYRRVPEAPGATAGAGATGERAGAAAGAGATAGAGAMAADKGRRARVEVLLVHPGGPYWAKKDEGAWSIPKGEAEPGELDRSRRADASGDPRAGDDPRVTDDPRAGAGGRDRLLAVAKREFFEETGLDPDELAAPGAAYVPLGGVKQRGHKIVYVWALEGDCDPAAIRSNEFEMEWPPRSGRTARFPEVDRAAWFDLPTAREKIVSGQRRFLDDLAALVG